MHISSKDRPALPGRRGSKGEWSDVDREDPRKPVALVVDGQFSARLVAVRGLTNERFTCHTATNGREALDLLDNGLRCDVVVTELALPQVNGRQLCLELLDRPRHPGLVVLSGSLDPALYGGLEDRGVDRLFFKPMSLRELAQAAAEVVAGRSAAVRYS